MDVNINDIDSEQRVILLENNNELQVINSNPSSKKNGIENQELKVSLTWTNLSYVIQERHTLVNLAKFKFRDALQSTPKVILHPQNGCATAGCLMAVMGRSGSGKSTLIESLTGRRVKNLYGDITINIHSKFSSLYDYNRLKIAFIPQYDYLLDTLTVEESIHFASKIKNSKVDKKYHELICNDLLDEFDLKRCRNVRVGACSGGQKKRLSVAMELVSKPTILIVDEPTSGLDSSSALQCIQLLKKLTLSVTNPVAIVVTIHQPSAKILNEFHKLYLLSYNGKCIYNGPVDKFLSHCIQFDINCPPFHNPADFAIEVASGDFGQEVVNQMQENQAIKSKEEIESPDGCEKVLISTIIASMSKHGFPEFFKQTSLLSKRAVITTYRDPYLTLLRLSMHLFVAIILILLYQNDIGNESGCIYGERRDDFSVYFSIDKIRQMQTSYLQNLGFFFFTITFLQLAPMMPTVIMFPVEMSVFLRERTNGWYSCLAFYFAKTIADVPFQLFFSVLYTVITYYLTGQPNNEWRFTMFLIVSILVAYIGQSIGLIVGAIWVENVNSAIFIAPLSVMPFTLLSGFFVRIPMIPNYLRPVTYISFVRFAFESFILCIYGFDRCEEKNGISSEDSVNGSSVVKESVNSVIFRFVNYINRLDLTYSNTRPILQALAVDKNQSLSELQSFDVYFKDFNTTNFMNLTLNENKSAIVQEFELEDDQLYTNIYLLCLVLMVLRVLTYIVLYIKANKRD